MFGDWRLEGDGLVNLLCGYWIPRERIHEHYNGRDYWLTKLATKRWVNMPDLEAALAAADCGLTSDSKAQAEQVRAVSADRLRGRIGAVPTQSLRQIDEAIRLHLSL